MFNKMEMKKKGGIATVIPDNIDFKTKAVTRDKGQSSNSSSWYLPEETRNTKSKNKTYIPTFIPALLTIAKTWKQV